MGALTNGLADVAAPADTADGTDTARAADTALIEATLQAAVPLRSEQISGFAARLAAISEASGRPVESITIGELLAGAPTPPAPIDKVWFALGKSDGSWFAIAPATADNPFPIVPVVKGRRRRLIEPTDLARARRFPTQAAAQDAGHHVFQRTYAITLASHAHVR